MYIIVFDLAKVCNRGDVSGASYEEAESRMSYWAQQIRDLNAFGGAKAPLLLVGTHADRVTPRDNMVCYFLSRFLPPSIPFDSLGLSPFSCRVENK